ncbi:MAG: integration host factor subunit beta [Dehalococcoidales bacterium]|nr:integration host factor subunit beta [Dehalococcoidales bacterium]
MNKSELIEALSQKLGLDSRQSASILNTLLEAMVEAMERGDDIEIRGFGSFTVKEYKPYVGRNPKSGKQIAVKPKKLPFFKVGKELKERVNN